MKIQNFKPKANSTRKKRIVGRGDGSGRGTYSTRGCKGAKARSGGTKKKGFEGGQTPLYRRLPKLKGFKSLNKMEYIEVNIEKLEKFSGDANEINLNELFNARVKVLGRGDVNKALNVKASKFSKIAKEKIEKIQGKAEVI
ncbi:MAG: 50S ribosomal protein L15 [Caldisericaceae bacterium]|nr:50S ribosomal protein L15 [Caldisericaceae bacterium]RLD20135.1 MAG: 50S ribosomal protein L15 [Caldisericota bacterium]